MDVEEVLNTPPFATGVDATSADGRKSYASAFVSFDVPGKPPGKPRMTQRDRWAKRPCVLRYWEWKDKVKFAFHASGGIPDEAIITSVNWVAHYEMPKSWTRKKRIQSFRTPHTSKPDRDNVDKALLDALFKDDSGVGCGFISKVWDLQSHLGVIITYQLPDLGETK